MIGRIDIRDAELRDFEAIQRIYSHHVETGLATFEETPPCQEELRSRYLAIHRAGLPYLIAELDDEVIGYCYAAPYRPRSAYRFTVEDSIYLGQDVAGRGVGMTLLGALIARCEQGAWRQMLAVIGDSANAGSIALHKRMGFTPVGVFRSVGFKHGRWVDTVLMQRPLGVGGEALPQRDEIMPEAAQDSQHVIP